MKRRSFIKGILGLIALPFAAKAAQPAWNTKQFKRNAPAKLDGSVKADAWFDHQGDVSIYENGEKMTITGVQSTPDGLTWSYR